jgi:hypothetical protein
MTRMLTTGEFRQRLLDVIDEVLSKKIKAGEASVIQKLAAQINKNMDAELKAAKAVARRGRPKVKPAGEEPPDAHQT